MSEYFDMIKEGLEEAIEYERGNKSVARSTKTCIKPIPEYTNINIMNIRNDSFRLVTFLTEDAE